MGISTLLMANDLYFKTLELPSLGTIISHIHEMVWPILVILGVLYIVEVIADWSIYSEFVSTDGKVIDFEHSISEKTGLPTKSGRPVVEYTAFDGKTYTIKGEERSYMSEREREMSANMVYYNIHYPEEAYIYEESDDMSSNIYFRGLVCSLPFIFTTIFVFIYITIKYITGAF